MSFIIDKNLDWESLVNSSEPIFWNFVFDKGRLKTFVSWFFKKYGEKKTLVLLEQLKELGFAYATKAGISLGIEDLKIPTVKNQLLAKAETNIQKSNFLYRQGRLTGIEKMQKFIETWHETSETLKEAVVQNFEKTDILNPVYMMAFSGARGNMSQVRQLVGMRGLMSDPQGKIIDFPIQSNFREGLTLTEYLISTYGARKGIVDTALRTATAGYLTRRLVDVAQHVIVSKFDCGTQRGIFLFDMKEGNQTLYSFRNRLIGRVLAQDIDQERLLNSNEKFHPEYERNLENSTTSIASRNQEVTFELALKISKLKKKALVRSPLTCENRKLVCQLCYGWSLATSRLVSIGEAVGVIAGQSIGEPGTQLTMRTFHTGGVFSAGVTQQINGSFSGVVEYAEPIAGTCVRTPHGQLAFLTKMQGTMFLKKSSMEVYKEPQTYKLPAFTILFMRHGQAFEKHEPIAQISALPITIQSTQTIEQTIYSTFEGEIYYDELDLLEDIDERYGERISTSEDWAKVWILAGKIYNPTLQSSFLPCAGDLLKRTTVVNQIRWASPTFLTAQNSRITFDQSQIETFHSLRYFSMVDLGKSYSSFEKDEIIFKSLFQRSNFQLVDTSQTSSQALKLKSINQLSSVLASEQLLLKLKSTKKSDIKALQWFNTQQPSTQPSEKKLDILDTKSIPHCRIRSTYLLKDFFQLSQNQSQKIISIINKKNDNFLKNTNSNNESSTFEEFLYFNSNKTKIFKTLITDSFSGYQRIKELQILIEQISFSFPRFAPGSLAQFINFSSNEKTLTKQQIVHNKVMKAPRVYFKDLTNTFEFNKFEQSTLLRLFTLTNYIPYLIQIKTLRNYFKSFKNSPLVDLFSNLSLNDHHASEKKFDFILSPGASLGTNLPRSDSSFRAQLGSQLKVKATPIWSLKTKLGKTSTTRKKTSSLESLKLENLNFLNVESANFQFRKPKQIFNFIRFDKLILKRPILSLPIQELVYSKLGYVLSVGSTKTRFFAFSSLDKKLSPSCLNLQKNKLKTLKNFSTDLTNSDAWKPLSFHTDLHWFPESNRFKFSGIVFFKSPKLNKKLFKQSLIQINLKAGKSFLTALELKEILHYFDLSHSQIQKKYALKSSCFFNLSNSFLFSTKLNSADEVQEQIPMNGILIKFKQYSGKWNLQTKNFDCLNSRPFLHIEDFKKFCSNVVDLSSFLTKKNSISPPSSVLTTKGTFKMKTETLTKNTKKSSDLKQLLVSLSRKEVKTINRPFFKTDEIQKNQVSFSELEWVPQENYRLKVFTKQKTLKELKGLFFNKGFLQTKNACHLMLYLTNLQGKKTRFSFKYEGCVSFNNNSNLLVNKRTLIKGLSLNSKIETLEGFKKMQENKEVKSENLQQVSSIQFPPESPFSSNVFPIDRLEPSQMNSDLVKVSSDSKSYLAELNLNFLVNFCPQPYTKPKTKSIGASEAPSRARKPGAKLQNNPPNYKNSKPSDFLTYSLKLSFLKYLNRKELNCYKKTTTFIEPLNPVYASFQKDFFQKFFTFIPLLKNQNSKLLQKSLKHQSETMESLSYQIAANKTTFFYEQAKLRSGKGDFLNLTVKPGWVYCPINLSEILQLNKVFVDSGNNFLDDILFEQHKVFIEILPKGLENLSYFRYTMIFQKSTNLSRSFKINSYVLNSKTRFVKKSPFVKQKAYYLLIRPVYFQILPAISKMKSSLYQIVQKQQNLNFFISFNFYKNYFSEVLNLQKNSLRVVTDISKIDINLEELSLFSAQEQMNSKKLVSKKFVSDSSKNVSENLHKKNQRLFSLIQNKKRLVDSQYFLRKFYKKKDFLNFVLSKTQTFPISLNSKNPKKKSLMFFNEDLTIDKNKIFRQTSYFSSSDFNYIQLNLSVSKNTFISESVFSELSFHQSILKLINSSPKNLGPYFINEVTLNGNQIKMRKNFALKTLKFENILKYRNFNLHSFDALAIFEYSVCSMSSFFANQRLFRSLFRNEEIELDTNRFRFREKFINAYLNSFVKSSVSKNILLLNSQNNNFGEIMGLTNFQSPVEGEVLTGLSNKLIMKKNVEKTLNVYLEKALQDPYQAQKLILTKSDIFSLQFSFVVPVFNLNLSTVAPPTVALRVSQDKTSPLFFQTKELTTTFNYLLEKYSNFKKLEKKSLQRLNSENYSLSNFQTNYKQKIYRLNSLKLEFLSETKKLRLGYFLQPGEKIYSKMSLLNSGQIIHLNSNFLTLRKAEFFSVSPKAILHTYNGDYLEKNLPVITLPFETLKTGDIVQGIPKVEQYLEARTTIKGRLFLNSLPVLLQAIYQRYLKYFNMENSVRQSFLKIQQILVDGVQRVYRSQGVSIADKHLEIIVRQMTSKVRIVHGGQTGFFAGELVDLEFVERLNRFLKVKIRYEPVVLGITRASLEVDSFLSAASFQQTTKVLTRAAVENRRDFLKGLKESLLVGNLLPAGTGYVLPIQKLNLN
jgi:hypothetical protein